MTQESRDPSPYSVVLGLQGAQGIGRERLRGIARYVAEHSSAILRADPGIVAGFHIDGTRPLPVHIDRLAGLGRLHDWNDPRQSPDLVSATKTIFHAMAPLNLDQPLSSVVPRRILQNSLPLAVTVYDLIPLVYPKEYLWDPTIELRFRARLRLIREADLILALSETTKTDLVEFLGVDPDDVHVIYGGASSQFRPPQAETGALHATLRREIEGLEGPYVLYTGGFDHRKNLTAAIEGFGRAGSEVTRNYQLVIACNLIDDERKVLEETARKNGLAGQVVLTGSVSDATLVRLYQACSLFVFPSLYEGLGLPILEAMNCDAPVIASARGSMKELVSQEGAGFDPEDVEDIGRAVRDVLLNESLRRDLIESSRTRAGLFTWDRAAEATIAAYEDLISRSGDHRPAPVQRKRVAVCSPYPPQKSGIADYTARFLEALGAAYPVDIDVVVSDDYPEPSEKGRRTRIITAREFQVLASRHYYDTVMYSMGNSSFHGYIYRLMKHIPGVVWLHDVRLRGFYGWYLDSVGSSSRFPVPFSSEDLQHDSYLCREVARLATRVVVNSSFAAEVVRLEAGWTTPVQVVPFAAPRVGSALDAAGLRRRYGLADDTRVVVSTGFIGPPKCPEVIIEALSLLPHRDLVLVFAGDLPDGADGNELRRLKSLASRIGVSERVLFTGYVPAEELAGWLDLARCAVQLRYPTNGESSAALMACLAQGCPTIVTAVGAMNEIPGNVVRHIAAPPHPDVLAAAIDGLISDEGLRQGMKTASLEFAARHSFDELASSIWQQVIQRPAARTA